MEFTGERFVPTEQDRIRAEHYHRYAVASTLVSGKDVLDLASGEGYGSLLLSEHARSVVGVDISEETIAHATRAYQRPNLAFRRGSAAALDLPDQSFDVVVSFETIEHLAEQAEMLSEIRRVLRRDGILVLSSPNRPVYQAESREHNRFHVKELDLQELEELLRGQFGSIRFLGQRMLMGSVIQPLIDDGGAFRAWHDDGEKIFPTVGALAEPTYFLAICGGKDLALPQLDSSILYPSQKNLVKHYMDFAWWAQSLNRELQQARDEIRRLSSERSVDTHDAVLRAELLEQKEKLATVLASRSWQVTRPLRGLYRSLQALPRLKRCIRLAARMVKKAYQALPFSEGAKIAHRKILLRTVPRLLALSDNAPEVQRPYAPPLSLPEAAPQDMVQENLSVLPRLSSLTSLTPEVSIIIPVFGQLTFTVHCLASIVRNPPVTAFEVIIVDDCSPDDTFTTLSHIGGLRLIRNQRNEGYIGSSNIGAAAARGRLLHFLNNDTAVTSGWLDELVLTFDRLPGTGLVGSKLMNADGTLQEAGGIIWRDGSAWNFGRGQDPNLPEYNYAREADYCSAASIVVEKVLFDEFGGFDPHYAPAYCEDADLALKIRDRGYRVIYQPRSVVVHYEGITSGRDETQGVKSYQVANLRKMFERWQVRLATHQRNGVDVDRAKDRMASRRVLVLDHCTPTPDQDAGSVLMYNTLLLFRELGFQATFIAEDNFLYMPGYTDDLQREGIEVLYWPFVHNVEEHLQKCGERYDLVYMARPDVVEHHIPAVRKFCPKARVLYNTIDLHFLRMEREAQLHNDPEKAIAASEMKQMEWRAMKSADGTIVVSTAELDLLKRDLPEEKVYLFPLISDVPGTKIGFHARQGIVFVGGYQHVPNVDAVMHFVENVMPHLRQILPGVPFYIVGSNVPAEITALECEDVIVTGYVEDLSAMLDKVRVCVAPLQYGAGIKGKVITAMSHGLPVVVTPIAIEGMRLDPLQDVLVADDPRSLADAVARLYLDEQLWKKLSVSGPKVAVREWGVEAAWKSLSAILNDQGFRSSRGSRPLTAYRARDRHKQSA